MKKTVALVLCAASTCAFAGEKLAEHVPGEIIVKFKHSAKKSTVFKELKGLNLRNKKSFSNNKYAVITIENKKSFSENMKNLNELDFIEYAEPNYIYKKIKNIKTVRSLLSSTIIDEKLYSDIKSKDPMFEKLWGLHNLGTNEPPTSSGGRSQARGIAGSDINALNAWAITKGSRNIRIAVIDTGVDYNHSDLKNNMWVNIAEKNGLDGVDDDGNGYIDDIHGYDFANQDGDPMDGNGHGTHCAGTIAAEHNNGVGIAGVMSEAEIVAVKFLTDSGSGSTEAAIESIDYAVKIGVDLMSNSWGGGGRSQALEDAIKRANKAGIIFTAAAGNSGTDNDSSPHYPSNYAVENVISVAAHNYGDNLATFSCYGSDTVHVAAPGRNILSTTPNDSYDVYSGTSMATPHVSGVIGLYLSENSSATPQEVRDNLMNSSVYGAAYGRKIIAKGRVDAYSFLTGVVAPRPPMPDENAWQRLGVETFESLHPYGNNVSVSKTYTVAGAKFVRVVLKKFDIEKKYDGLKVLDGSGSIVETIDGDGVDRVSEYVDGDTITLAFDSDNTVDKWGYIVEEIEVIK